MMDSQKISKSKAYIMPFIVIIVLSLILFLPAGTLRFWQAWIYLTIFSIITIFMIVYFSKKSPELLTRRSEFREQEKVRKIPPFLKLFLVMYLIPGLDFRFNWSAVPLWLVIVANIMVCSGYIFIIIVFNENSYASATIKLENEQRVISTGPYAIIRHPMYAGMLLMTFFTPLALGSYWALIPCILFIPWLYLRIKNEEEILLNELPGYGEYCGKIKYRLLPLIW
ncbi:MAG: isoprenylcysteine carboxylmethyltransferase family protein [Bacteroidota bacterium]|nr:isoprenylcysteine carboxylmethyltransferase family protein [Bacteroidota bacterium]